MSGLPNSALCQQHFDLVVSVHILHQCIVQLRPDAKTIQKRSGVRLGLPAVHLCEFAFELTGADAVLIGEVLLGSRSLPFPS